MAFKNDKRKMLGVSMRTYFKLKMNVGEAYHDYTIREQNAAGELDGSGFALQSEARGFFSLGEQKAAILLRTSGTLAVDKVHTTDRKIYDRDAKPARATKAAALLLEGGCDEEQGEELEETTKVEAYMADTPNLKIYVTEDDQEHPTIFMS